jgi:hypothetical protein
MVAHIAAQAVVVQDVQSLITIVLHPLSTKYPWWHDMMLLALRRYTLEDHVFVDKIDNNAYRYHYDKIKLMWMLGTLFVELQDIIHEPSETA